MGSYLNDHDRKKSHWQGIRSLIYLQDWADSELHWSRLGAKCVYSNEWNVPVQKSLCR